MSVGTGAGGTLGCGQGRGATSAVEKASNPSGPQAPDITFTHDCRPSRHARLARCASLVPFRGREAGLVSSLCWQMLGDGLVRSLCLWRTELLSAPQFGDALVAPARPPGLLYLSPRPTRATRARPISGPARHENAALRRSPACHHPPGDQGFTHISAARTALLAPATESPRLSRVELRVAFSVRLRAPVRCLGWRSRGWASSSRLGPRQASAPTRLALAALALPAVARASARRTGPSSPPPAAGLGLEGNVRAHLASGRGLRPLLQEVAE